MSEPVVSADWEPILELKAPPDHQKSYREAIATFRYWMREKGKNPVAETPKQHLA
jgi:hypothetical protein